MTFACRLIDDDPDAACVRVAGELDISTTAQLDLALSGALSQAGLVVLDLQDVVFIDCCGVHAIAGACVRARQAGHHLRVLRAQPVVDRIFALVESFGEPAVGFCDAAAPSVDAADHRPGRPAYADTAPARVLAPGAAR